MSRPDLLLLHGALGTREQFMPFIPLLEGHFQPHTLNFEGHGDTAAPDRPFAIAHFAQTVLDYLDQQAITRVNLFGYSMGGFVALYLALNYPERVNRVFTLATKLDWTPETAARETAMLDPDKMLAKVPRYAQQLEQQHSALGWRELLRRTATLLTHLGEHNPLSIEALGQIMIPVRISLGDRDTMVTLDESLAAYHALQKGQFQVFPDTPHPFDRVSLGRLAAALVDYFAGSDL